MRILLLMLLLSSCSLVSKKDLGTFYENEITEKIVDKAIQQNCHKCFKQYIVVTETRQVHKLSYETWLTTQIGDSIRTRDKMRAYINGNNDTIIYKEATKFTILYGK